MSRQATGTPTVLLGLSPSHGHRHCVWGRRRRTLPARLLRLAEQGDASAQYTLGGGVLEDPVLAHMWYNIAGANGKEPARGRREGLESVMTREDISRATELARRCMASNYQECGF